MFYDIVVPVFCTICAVVAAVVAALVFPDPDPTVDALAQSVFCTICAVVAALASSRS